MVDNHTHGFNAFTCCIPRRSRSLPSVDESTPVVLHFEQPEQHAAPAYRSEIDAQAPNIGLNTRASTWLGDNYDQLRHRASTFSRRSILRTQSKARPRISAPTDFRRVSEPSNTISQQGPRLELRICRNSGRISPLPNFDAWIWGEDRTQLQQPARALIRSESLHSNRLSDSFSVRRKPVSIQLTGDLATYEETGSIGLCFEHGPGPIILDDDTSLPAIHSPESERTPTLAPARIESMARSYGRPQSAQDRSDSRLSDSQKRPQTTRSGRSWGQSEFIRQVRSPSISRAKEDTIDEAIRELNSIVEERRRSAMNKGIRSPSQLSSRPLSPSHVPAIAPSMKLNARSEILNDIGSAFRVPLAMDLPSSPSPAMDLPSSPSPAPSTGLVLADTAPRKSSLSTDSPTLPLSPPPVAMKNSTRLRLTNWLRQSPSTSATQLTASGAEIDVRDFQSAEYQQHPQSWHTQARPSVCTVNSYIVSAVSAPSEHSYSDIGIATTTPTTSIFPPSSALSSSDTSPYKREDPQSTYTTPRTSFSRPVNAISVSRSSHTPKHNNPNSRRGLSVETTGTTYSGSTAAASTTTSALSPPLTNFYNDPLKGTGVITDQNCSVGVAF